MTLAGDNWGGNVTYRAGSVVAPSSLDELATAVVDSAAAGRSVAVRATRHSFNTIGDADVLLDVSGLGRAPEVGADHVVVTPTTTYTDVAVALEAERRALPNLASRPHISVAGAIATGTHGSGVDQPILATAVSSIELMDASGARHTFGVGDSDFGGAVVHLGALGVVTSITLRTEPTYEVTQHVHDGITWDTVQARFDEVAASASSVSIFSRLGGRPGEVWRKQRTDRPAPRPVESFDGEFATVAATTPRHPLPGEDPTPCTRQLGVPGPWWMRLPHFRHDAVPSAGAEIQSEFFVARHDTAAAIDALRSVGSRLDDVLLVSEIRTVAADDLWLSPATGRDATGFHFTWRLDSPAVDAAIEVVADVLAPFDARPHWGKALPADFTASDSYGRVGDFLELNRRLDPTETFTTPWFRRHVR